jgi:ribosome maturation protein Sdo1
LKGYGSVKAKRWLADGKLQVDFEVLAGIQAELFEKVSALTRGDFESKILKEEELEK